MFTTVQNPITLPPSWKTLPLLCLPDGSHNYDSDSIYFTMPDNSTIEETPSQDESRNDGQDGEGATRHKDGIRTIFGTACYRQIQVEKLLHRTEDMTRIAVQKSVCVLSTQPLFGLIRSKLEMITHAYFEELDFSKVRILKLTYNNLNSLLSRESVRENATFLGLSARHLVSFFGNNMLVLFKAMLLEKKILFYKTPVRDLCSTIMSMCSLFNGLLECGGLDHSTCDLQLSTNLLEALKLEPHPQTTHNEVADEFDSEPRESRVFFSPTKDEVIILSDKNDSGDKDKHEINQSIESREDTSIISRANDLDESQKLPVNDVSSDYEVINQSSVADGDTEAIETSLGEETIVDDPHAHKLCQLKPRDCGFPLQIFTRGSFCLPYLSISYLDLLSDTRVRSFVIGATNFLFKQRREMYDIIVDMEENTITINDPKLKRLLNLTVEDLRFMDYLAKNVKMDKDQGASSSVTSDHFDPLNVREVTEWVGGDEWIRYHFKIYTLYLLKAAKHQANQGQRTNTTQHIIGPSAGHQSSVSLANQFVESFNGKFLAEWRCNTNNYRIWDSSNKASILDGLQSKHPFGSQVRGMNFSDMKLKLSYAVNSSEKGRLVSQTLNGIGKWSIWNNLASAGNMAANTIGSTLATSAASAHSALVNTIGQEPQQSIKTTDAPTAAPKGN